MQRFSLWFWPGLRTGARMGAWGLGLLGAIVLTGPAALAQTNDSIPEPIRDLRTNGDVKPNTIEGSGISPMDIMRQILLNNGQSSEEFQSRSGDRLNSAADQFRLQQQQRLGSSSSSPNSRTPGPATPQ